MKKAYGFKNLTRILTIVLILVMLATNNPILKGWFAGLRQKTHKRSSKEVSGT